MYIIQLCRARRRTDNPGLCHICSSLRPAAPAGVIGYSYHDFMPLLWSALLSLWCEFSKEDVHNENAFTTKAHRFGILSTHDILTSSPHPAPSCRTDTTRSCMLHVAMGHRGYNCNNRGSDPVSVGTRVDIPEPMWSSLCCGYVVIKSVLHVPPLHVR